MKKIFILMLLFISFSAKAAGIEDVLQHACFGPPQTKGITEITIAFLYILGIGFLFKFSIIAIKKYKSKKTLNKENELI